MSCVKSNNWGTLYERKQTGKPKKKLSQTIEEENKKLV